MNSAGQGGAAPVRPSLSVATSLTTDVLQTRINVGTNANINAVATPVDVVLNGASTLDELSLNIVGNTFELTPGDYEITGSFNLTSTAFRSNFLVDLMQGATTIDTLHGSAYARGATGHTETNLHFLFQVSPTVASFYSVATRREAGNDGAVSLDGGIFIVRRFSQKPVVETVTLA